MPEFPVAPHPWPSKGEAAREYLLDMLQQLARLARASGEVQIAILLEAVLAVDQVVRAKRA